MERTKENHSNNVNLKTETSGAEGKEGDEPYRHHLTPFRRLILQWQYWLLLFAHTAPSLLRFSKLLRSASIGGIS